MNSPATCIARAQVLVSIAREAGVQFRWHKGQVGFQGATPEQAAFIIQNENAFAPALVLELVEGVFGPCHTYDRPYLFSLR